MAERSASGTELAVQELRKKARRRLVGAIVLALAAAVILPLLLEKEPKPLGDDVSVQIPPIDESKFVNRLTGRASEGKPLPKGATKSEPKADPKAESRPESAPEGKSDAAAPVASPAPETAPITPPPAPEARKSVSEAEQRVLSPSPKAPAKADAGKAPKPDVPEMRAAPETTSAAAPSQALPPPAPAPAPVAAAPTKAPSPSGPAEAAAAKPEGFAVQIAAFTDDKGANALAGKLKKAGFASTYVEPVQTSRGTLWRVRVGGYPVRADADAARAKLKADGWNGIVVSAK